MSERNWIYSRDVRVYTTDIVDDLRAQIEFAKNIGDRVDPLWERAANEIERLRRLGDYGDSG